MMTLEDTIENLIKFMSDGAGIAGGVAGPGFTWVKLGLESLGNAIKHTPFSAGVASSVFFIVFLGVSIPITIFSHAEAAEQSNCAESIKDYEEIILFEIFQLLLVKLLLFQFYKNKFNQEHLDLELFLESQLNEDAADFQIRQQSCYMYLMNIIINLFRNNDKKKVLFENIYKYLDNFRRLEEYEKNNLNAIQATDLHEIKYNIEQARIAIKQSLKSVSLYPSFLPVSKPVLAMKGFVGFSCFFGTFAGGVIGTMGTLQAVGLISTLIPFMAFPYLILGIAILLGILGAAIAIHQHIKNTTLDNKMNVVRDIDSGLFNLTNKTESCLKHLNITNATQLQNVIKQKNNDIALSNNKSENILLQDNKNPTVYNRVITFFSKGKDVSHVKKIAAQKHLENISTQKYSLSPCR